MPSDADRERYVNPLVERYATREMIALFSDQTKFRTWRRLWIALAEAERELGLAISAEQIEEMKAKADDIPYAEAARLERELRHDVMAHIRAFAQQCPRAAPIIHLGATSAYVVDNTDLIVLREGMRLVRVRLVTAIRRLAEFAERWADQPTLGFTHFQPAQITTVGKRACLWLQDLLLDLGDLEAREADLAFLGVRGATGTQASFLALFEGDAAKTRALDAAVARRMGFERTWPVSGQTYPRKADYRVLTVLSGVAQSAAKMSADLRLLQSLREIEEPFEKDQVGSSAMAYKRNPMRCERINALARFVMVGVENTAHTAASQWFERTLDDSANRRLVVPETFLAADAILLLAANVAAGLVVHPPVIEKHLRDEVPFMATENILMEAVRAGGDRQDLHERIRVHSHAAANLVKNGQANDLPERLEQDDAFRGVRGRMSALLDPRLYVGLAPEQTREFLARHVRPALDRHRDVPDARGEVKV